MARPSPDFLASGPSPARTWCNLAQPVLPLAEMRSQPPRRSKMSTVVFAGSWPAGLASRYGVAIRSTAERVVPASLEVTPVLLAVVLVSLAVVPGFLATMVVSLAGPVSSAQAVFSAASPASNIVEHGLRRG